MNTFDFQALDNEDFKEDSVRELLIAPLLKELGFVLRDSKESSNKSKEINKDSKLEMALSLKLTSPTITGSNEKITFTRFPDYVLYVDSKPHCVLDAKAPKVEIGTQSKAERQAFYYAINPQIKAPFYALCNGKFFNLFETNGQNLLKEFSCKELFNSLNCHSERSEESKKDISLTLNRTKGVAQDNNDFLLLKQYLTTPIESLRQTLAQDSKTPKKPDSWYLSRELPKAIVNPKKQSKARYFGCTAYFTRQSWDIVEQNIKNFTDKGDVVLDSFGGSGVTAIEAMMNGRIGIHTDLNPLSIFMTKALSAQVDLSALYELSEAILSEFESIKPKNEKEARQILKNAKYYPNALDSEFGEIATQKQQDSTLWIPQDEILPKGSDVDSVLKLFSKKQLAELALLRKLIFKHTAPSRSKEQRIIKRNMRYALMLGFRNMITQCNLTYHISSHKGLTGKAGNSAAFLYYRYRIAKNPTFVDTAESFRGKIQRVIKGKQELESAPNDLFYQSYFYPLANVIKDFNGALLKQRNNLDKTDSLLNKTNGEKIFQADATDLKEIESLSIDFIYTDPPYGAKIPYLDLSTMWNVWLDLPVDSSLKEKECIEKGSFEKSREEYHALMKKSLKEMYRVLKWNRWLAFVFQHQDPQLWQILVEEAQNIGFEYVGSIRQDNGQTTFKKRQFKASVLSGQLIIYFKKVQSPKALIKEHLDDDITALVLNHAEALIARDDGATLEEIHAEITIKGLELGFLHQLGKDYADLTPLINANFDLDEVSGKYHIKKGQKFKSHAIPLERRTKYFLLSYLRGAKRQGKKAYFDDICLSVIPLLKNGVSPSKELIKEILESIAIPMHKSGEWVLKGEDIGLFSKEDLL
ncbi:DNA methylase [Helicobacter muridarum]|uniref:DNA methylase n=1 Tax=Helicobacter muridarum TaxID=216 RepID=A0A099TX44_9HELI|nr:DNA methyltransferase [Helicobacter muridarum]TLE00242.1 DNA methylase [Helicobacter muridarum]STQ85734.1 type II R/M system [Helicobacter muridarum]